MTESVTKLAVTAQSVIDAEHEKTGASKRDIRDGLKCYKCGGRYHISKDCGKKEDNEQKQKHSESSAMSTSILNDSESIHWYGSASSRKIGLAGEDRATVNTEIISLDNHSNTSIFNNKKLLNHIFKPAGRHFLEFKTRLLGQTEAWSIQRLLAEIMDPPKPQLPQRILSLIEYMRSLLEDGGCCQKDPPVLSTYHLLVPYAYSYS